MSVENIIYKLSDWLLSFKCFYCLTNSIYYVRILIIKNYKINKKYIHILITIYLCR